MGRIRSATNFVLTVEKREPPLNTPAEAVDFRTFQTHLI